MAIVQCGLFLKKKHGLLFSLITGSPLGVVDISFWRMWDTSEEEYVFSVLLPGGEGQGSPTELSRITQTTEMRGRKIETVQREQDDGKM